MEYAWDALLDAIFALMSTPAPNAAMATMHFRLLFANHVQLDAKHALLLAHIAAPAASLDIS